MKKCVRISSLLANIILLVVGIVLIPINFAADVPEWLPALFCGLSAVGISVYIIIFKPKLVAKILLPICFVLVGLTISVAPFVNPYWNSYMFRDFHGEAKKFNDEISYKEAEEDFEYLLKYLKKVHPLFIDGLTDEVKERYNQALDRLKADDEITVNDLQREMQLFLSPLHDAHTTTFRLKASDYFLSAAPEKAANGYTVSAVNGVTSAKIKENARPYYCYESEDWVSVDVGSLATLEFYGFSAPYTFVWSNGTDTITETYSEQDFVPYQKFIEIALQYVEETPKNFVYYEINEAKNLAVLTLTQCNYNDFYKETLKEMFTEIKEKNIGNIAVDLRGNGGGNSMVVNEFIKYLPVEEYVTVPFEGRFGFVKIKSDGEQKNRQKEELTFEGKVYVLTDHGSFSSAMMFPMIIQDNELGKVIGESPANATHSYGDIVTFVMPNSKLCFQVSHSEFWRTDEDKTELYVVPDYECDGEDVFATLYGIIAE